MIGADAKLKLCLFATIFVMVLGLFALNSFSQDITTDQEKVDEQDIVNEQNEVDDQKPTTYNVVIYNVNGERIKGSLENLELTIKTAAGEIKVPISEVALIDFVSNAKQVSAKAYLHLLRGRDLLRSGFDDEALYELRTAVSQSPRYTDAIFELGKLLYKQGRKNESMELFSRVAEEEPYWEGIDNYLKEIADWHLNKKDTAKAADIYLKLFTEYPQNKDAKFCSYKAGFLYAWELKDNEKAISTLESAVGAFPNDPNAEKALYEIGRLYMEEGNLESAENAFNNLISLFPTGERNDNAHYSLASIYQSKNQYVKAMQEINNVMKNSTDQDLLTLTKKLLDELAWTVYDVSDGLPSDYIHCLAMDNDCMWIGTSKGVAKFDMRMGLITHGIILPNIDIVSLAVDDVSLWIGTSDSWVKQYDKVRDEIIQDSPPKIQGDIPEILSMCVDRDSLWVGTEAGIYKYYRMLNEWGHHTLENGLPDNRILSLVSTPKGVWCGTLKGSSVYDYSTGEWHVINKQSKLEEKSISVIDFAGNNIWFAWYEHLRNGISRYDPISLTWKEWALTEWEADADETHSVNSDTISLGAGEYDVWIGTDSVTIYYDYRTSQWSNPLNYPSQLVGHAPSGIAVDNDSVWFATSKGLGRLNKLVLTGK